MENGLTYDEIDTITDFIENTKDRIPIRQGCPNSICYCTGECQKIIGFRDRLPEEKYPKPPKQK